MKHEPACNRTTRRDNIGLAHDIAVLLWDAGVRGPDGTLILGMAMGIYMEAQEGAHRGLKPIADALCAVAVQTYDAFQAAREREEGHA